MLTTWVPREAKVAVINIPPELDFLADVATGGRPFCGLYPSGPSCAWESGDARLHSMTS